MQILEKLERQSMKRYRDKRGSIYIYIYEFFIFFICLFDE